MKGCRYFFVLLFIFAGFSSFAQEICNNGKDDDGDGLIDLQDPDCQCHYNVSGNLLQNGSFEMFKNCPTNYSYENDFNIADFWQYGTYTSVNEADYYHNFKCSYDSSQVMLYLPPSLPLPDGSAFMSIRQYVYRKPDMKETDIAKVYISQCLPSPLIPGKQYTFSFSAGRFKSNDDHTYKFREEPFTVAMYGHPDCGAVPFGPPHAQSNGCPSNFPGWVLLGKATVRSKGRWVQAKFNFSVPENINVIEIGPDCSNLVSIIDQADSTTFLDYYVYDLDDLHLLPTDEYHFQYIQSLGRIRGQDACARDSVLSVPFYSDATYQWYKDSIAIIGATSNQYPLPAENPDGNYNVLISNADTCLVSEPFTVLTNPLGSLSLPADTSICENDTVLLAPPLAGVTYNWNGKNDKSVVISMAGVYDITALAANGCSKAFTVNVHSQNCSTFMPNAFTPNGDGINDLFRIPPNVNLAINDFLIFDRLGNKVFSTRNRREAWDGNYNGKKSAEGIYIYVIDGSIGRKEIRIKGFVTLIR